ncbi:hypothetical protein [Glaciecola petra]|uniref:Tetratricopeptide repeat protein n=1 Tax=Glaciecola petra TaxID=3075602 RepID=A0ABU2ZSJ2_9ALTE|nr:hypothetical protein [Aestuariibacter sp. P117]MDT0595602.1 hypothetical protein [Aestuariibacter sp. P117]
MYLNSKFTRKGFYLLIAFLCIPLKSGALQSNNENSKEPSTELVQNAKEATEQDEVIETIIVEGNNYNDALRAFNRGDFALAEIEFKKNARCAHRMERNKRAFINGLQTSSINNNVQSSASLGGGGGPEGNSTIQTNTTASPVTGGNARRQKSKSQQQELTCENRAYQLYMTALSQIQLGRNEEAEENLEIASFLNKNIYDAHYRLALMQLLRNNKDEAEDRLDNLQDVLKRCRDCEAKPEIVARIQFVEKAIAGEIKLE